MPAQAQADPCHILEVDGDTVQCVDPRVDPGLPLLLPPPVPVETELQFGVGI